MAPLLGGGEAELRRIVAFDEALSTTTIRVTAPSTVRTGRLTDTCAIYACITSVGAADVAADQAHAHTNT